VVIAPLYGEVILAELTLVGYWRLGEPILLIPPPPLGTPARDSGKLKRDGNYSKAGVKVAVPGALTLDADTAAHFDGLTGVVVVPYDMRLNPAQNFSLEAWIRPDNANPGTAPHSAHSVLSSRQIVVDPVTGRDQYSGFELTVVRDPAPTAQHGITAKVGSGTTIDHQVFVPVAWPQADWVHVVLVGDVQGLLPPTGPKLILHVDAKSTAFPIPPTSYRGANGRPLRIGAGRSEQTNPTEFFAGALDEVAIYNAALTAAQVAKHHNAR
jgi:hypothetical protein